LCVFDDFSTLFVSFQDPNSRRARSTPFSARTLFWPVFASFGLFSRVFGVLVFSSLFGPFLLHNLMGLVEYLGLDCLVLARFDPLGSFGTPQSDGFGSFGVSCLWDL